MVEVADRLEEAFQTLGRLPMTIRPKAYGNSMPAPAYERPDFNAQLETGQFFADLRERNVVRRQPTPDEIKRMDEALAWPLRFLNGHPELARAVCLGALWANSRVDVKKRCKAMGMTTREFHRIKVEGLKLIAIALARSKTPAS